MKLNISKLIENRYYSNDEGQNYLLYDDAHNAIATAIERTQIDTISALLGIVSDMDILSPSRLAEIERKALERLQPTTYTEIYNYLCRMDSNGDYDIEFIKENGIAVIAILSQWLLDGGDSCKIKSYIEFLRLENINK